MRDAADTGRADVDRAWVCFGSRDDISHRMVSATTVCSEHDGGLANATDWNEVALDIVRHFLDERRVQRNIAPACHHKRIAIRISLHGGRHCNQSVTSSPVFHADLV